MFERITIPFVTLLLGSASVGCASTADPDRDSAPIEAAAVDRWPSVVAEEAHRLAERWPEATVRIAVIDVETGSLLAQAGPIDEPHATGSTIKPFTVAAAYTNGVAPDQEVDGAAVELGSGGVHDAHPVERMRVDEVLIRSSNVGIARLTQDVDARRLYTDMAAMTGLPEQTDSDDAALVRHLFGGDTTMSTTELGRAYAMLAAGGIDVDSGARVVSESVAADVLDALERAVTSEQGTGRRAAVEGTRVAGKTGTARGPDEGLNTALFVGMGPLPDPKWVVAVVVEGASADAFGGSVAAPAFSRLVEAASPAL